MNEEIEFGFHFCYGDVWFHEIIKRDGLLCYKNHNDKIVEVKSYETWVFSEEDAIKKVEEIHGEEIYEWKDEINTHIAVIKECRKEIKKEEEKIKYKKQQIKSEIKHYNWNKRSKDE